MHEVRAALPPECVLEAVRLANSVGIERVTVTEAFVHGLEAEVQRDQRGDLDAEGPCVYRRVSGLPGPLQGSCDADLSRASRGG